MAKKQTEQPEQTLLCNLIPELFQTEKSAIKHPRREARRLGDCPPAQALLAVSAHAEAVMRELPALCKRCELPVSRAGQALGALFSGTRELITDRLMDRERSYRGTLLGMRHGIDVVLVVKHASQRSGFTELASFCDRWLGERIPLVKRVEDELAWFTAHPDQALEPAVSMFRRQGEVT